MGTVSTRSLRWPLSSCRAFCLNLRETNWCSRWPCCSWVQQEPGLLWPGVMTLPVMPSALCGAAGETADGCDYNFKSVFLYPLCSGLAFYRLRLLSCYVHWSLLLFLFLDKANIFTYIECVLVRLRVPPPHFSTCSLPSPPNVWSVTRPYKNQWLPLFLEPVSLLRSLCLVFFSFGFKALLSSYSTAGHWNVAVTRLGFMFLILSALIPKCYFALRFDQHKKKPLFLFTSVTNYKTHPDCGCNLLADWHNPHFHLWTE